MNAGFGQLTCHNKIIAHIYIALQQIQLTLIAHSCSTYIIILLRIQVDNSCKNREKKVAYVPFLVHPQFFDRERTNKHIKEPFFIVIVHLYQITRV